MLSSQETELRIAAGETIAMFYEIGRIEDEVCLTLCLLGNFAGFSKSAFLKKFFQESLQSVKQF